MTVASLLPHLIRRRSQTAATTHLKRIRIVQNWEQGHRRPEGTARALLRVAESHPEAVLEALHR